MAKTVEQHIAEANARLRAGRVGLTIQLLRNSLFLQGVLPPKPNATKVINHQQRIPTRCLGNVAGIQRAEAIAHEVAAKLIKREFVWADYADVSDPNTDTAETLIKRFKADYLQHSQETSYQNYYLAAYKWLPQDKPITAQEAIAVLERHEQSTRSREVAYIAFNKLLKFCKLEFDLTAYRSTYTASSLNARDIPSDQEIVTWYERIPNQEWRNAYAIFALYGLRNHEIFHFDWEFPNLRVVEGKTNTATNTRLVYPLHPEWADRFNLTDTVPMPTTTREKHKAQGQTVSNYFRRLELPFTIYALRHAWAIRNIGYGISDTVSARAMGHAVDVHTKTYQRWMGDRDMEAVVNRAINNPNRPIAPI